MFRPGPTLDKDKNNPVETKDRPEKRSLSTDLTIGKNDAEEKLQREEYLFLE